MYTTTAGSPYNYVYWNFMACTVDMGDNDMRKPHPHTKLVHVNFYATLLTLLFIPEGYS